MNRLFSKAARRPTDLSRRGRSTTLLNTMFLNARSHNARPFGSSQLSGSRLSFEPLEDRRMLAVFSVDNLNDSGAGSLRAAIAAANLSTGTADEITFAVTGTINIASQLPTITDALTITGPGANLLTINAGHGTDHVPATNDGYRVFSVDNGNATLIDVAISGLTLTGGDTSGDGGGVLNRERLTLSKAIVSGNHAANVGGGVFNSSGALTVADSTFAGNSSVSGGGIFSLLGSLAVSGSTLSGNTATSVGGGLLQSNGTAIVANSTLSGNTAGSQGGGLYLYRGTPKITSSIIAGNGAAGGSEIRAVLNENLNSFNLIGDSSKTTAQALLGVSAAATDILATSNGAHPTALAAILAPLADNGGPTPTHALVAGSLALDAGSPLANLAPGGVATQSSEYAAVSLPAANAIDHSINTFTSTGLEDANATWQVTLASDAAVTSVVLLNRLQNQSRLRDITVEVLNSSGVVVATSALLNPENVLGGGQLDFGPATLTFDLVAATGGAVVGRTIRVRRAPDPDKSGSGGQGNEGEPNLLSLGEVEVNGVAVSAAVDQRGAPFDRIVGGRIDIGSYESQSLALVVDTLTDESDGNFAAGDLSLREALELANANPGADAIGFNAALAGGTINLNPALGQLVISGSVNVTGLGANRLTVDAGGASRVLNITSGTVQVSGLTLTGGNADRGGGLRNAAPAVTTLSAMAIQGNTATSATDAGGGIWSSSNIVITSSTISSNTTPNGRGGGAYISGVASIDSSTISGNSAGGIGGGLFHNGSGSFNAVDIAKSTITGNTAVGSGGGFYKATGMATISSSVVSGNSAFGGAEISQSIVTTGISLVGFNLVGDSSKTTAQAIYLTVIGPNTILATSNGTAPTALSAILRPLADNGGPTKTHALTAGSPAINGGASAVGNLATGGVATQSSAYFVGGTYPASNAIDGNAATFSHTASEDTSASWQVTLVGDFGISQVVLHNRVTNQSRLRDITIEVLNSSGAVVATSPLLNPENVLGGGVLSAGPATLTFDLVATVGASVLGRTIRVRRTADPDLSGVGGSGDAADQNVLSLTEVEVTGIEAPGGDQRGASFARIVNGVIDLGAYEVQAPLADFNFDGVRNGNDFLAWQRGLGTAAPNALKSQGDADNDGDVDGADLAVWKSQFGSGPIATAAATPALAAAVVALDEPEGAVVGQRIVLTSDLVDAAMAVTMGARQTTGQRAAWRPDGRGEEVSRLIVAPARLVSAVTGGNDGARSLESTSSWTLFNSLPNSSHKGEKAGGMEYQGLAIASRWIGF